jgi:hypothetical protein
MAQYGDDPRISRMLLDVADDFDAEADLLDAEVQDQGGFAAVPTLAEVPHPVA